MMTVRDRSCGPCTACCVFVAVEALNKPAGVKCSKLRLFGCSVYSCRPSDCSGYKCLWLAGYGPTHARPDLTGVIIDVHGTPEGPVIIFHKIRNGVAVNAPPGDPRPYAIIESDGVTATLCTPASWDDAQHGRFVEAFRNLDTDIKSRTT